ncbi:MAG: glycosyltransferase [Bryobacteraceae bacterium]
MGAAVEMGETQIAVIMPVRNGMPLLADSIESIRAQAYPSLEIVVVDDGSTDGTLEYLEGLGSLVSKVLRTGGSGPAAARNAGIRASSAPLLAFLDADDLWEPGALRLLEATLRDHPDAGLAQGKIRNFRVVEGQKEFFTPPYRFLNLGACLWRRRLLESIGMLTETLRLCEDLDLLMRCWERDIPKAEVEAVILHYRRHGGNMTRGLAGADVGTLAAHKMRLDRIRAGQFDPKAPRRFRQAEYLGTGPESQDLGFRNPAAGG